MSATKDDIAAVFERHAERFGYSKTTLDEVATELHISKKTIYAHFDGKADIYGYIVARMADRERRRMAAEVAELPTYRAKVETLVRYILGMSRAHIVETDEAEWMQEYEIAADAFRTANGDLLRELVAKGMEAGEFPKGDPRLVERMLAAMIVEYVLMVRAEPGFDRDGELVERISRFVG